MAASVETMGAQLALRQAYCLNQILKLAEFQRLKSEAAAHNLHQLLILRAVGGGILLKILVLVALQLFDYAACDKLQVALRAGKAYKRTTIDEWWACYALKEGVRSQN